MEFAHAARALGLRAIHGAEDSSLDDGRGHHHTAGARRAWLAQPLPASSPRAHAHTRDGPARRTRRRAVGRIADGARPRRGAGLPDRLRRARGVARRADGRAGCCDAFGAGAAAGRAAAPVPARRSRSQPARWRRWPGGWACACVATGNVHAHAAPRAAAAGRVRRAAPTTRRSTPQSLCGAATSAMCWPRRRRWPAASPSIPRRSPRRCGWPSGCASISTAISATAIPGAEDEAPSASWRSCAPCACGSATRPAPMHGEAQRAPGGGAAVIDELGWPGSSCCTTRCSSWRARWRSRCAARHARGRCCRPGAGAGRGCPRSSATSPGSRTSTRSPTACCSGASSTRS